MRQEGVTVVSHAVEPGADGGVVVLEALALEPSAVVYDLSDGHRPIQQLSATFDAVDAYLSLWSGTPLLVHIPDGTQAAVLQAHPLSRRVTTWPTLASALAAAQQHRRLDRLALDLDPGLSAPRAARELVDLTLDGWRLQRFATDAKILLTEMVTNVVVHAETAMTVSLSRHDGTRAIRVAVRDGSNALPVVKPLADPPLSGAMGLWILGSIAQGWGAAPLRAGKVVWAVLQPRLDGRASDGKARTRIW